MDNEKKFILKAYSIKELHNLYGVSWVTFNKWIQPIREALGDITGRKLTPKQVSLIVDKLGEP